MIDAGHDINGFIVVRKPTHANFARNYRLGAKDYHGRDRLPWEDLDDAYYAKALPADLLAIRHSIKGQNRDLSGVEITRNFAEAAAVHAAWADRSDLIAVWSPDLVPIKGRMTSPVPLKWLGYDCIASGEWSLLLDGVYSRPEHFPDSVRAINASGLFDTVDHCRLLSERYIALSKEEIVEPLSDTPTFISLRIYTVQQPHVP